MRRQTTVRPDSIFAFGIAFVVVLIVLAIFFPTHGIQDRNFLHGLGSGGGQRRALIPGLLHIQTPWLRAGSALAVFMLIFKFSPKSLVAPVMTEFRGG